MFKLSLRDAVRSERYPKVNWIIGSCIPKMKLLNHVKKGTGIVAYRGAGK